MEKYRKKYRRELWKEREDRERDRETDRETDRHATRWTDGRADRQKIISTQYWTSLYQNKAQIRVSLLKTKHYLAK